MSLDGTAKQINFVESAKLIYGNSTNDKHRTNSISIEIVCYNNNDEEKTKHKMKKIAKE